MKPSFYNYLTSLPDNTLLGFNFYTLNLLALNPEEAALAQEILRNPLQALSGRGEGVRKLLAEKGFLIEAAIDEREILRESHHQSRLQQRSLGLTILPSLSCNFRCVYCYENHDGGKMLGEVEEAIALLVKNQLAKGGNLSVTWFGGEPLMQMDIIERLSKSFLETCEDRGARYSADIITNGYLLTGEVAEKLSRLQVKLAQVTLDGPEQIHDQRRPAANGGKTFQTIFDNLKMSAKIIPINLRINADHLNRDFLLPFLEVLVQEGSSPRIMPYLGKTYPYTEACSDMAGSCLTNEDFSLLTLEFEFELLKKGFTTFHMPKSQNTYCLADCDNSFVITPTGGIVNCWNDVSNPQAEIGHLLEPYRKEMGENAAKWLLRDPFQLECFDCLLLPICMGGCPFLFQKTGKVHCINWKYHLNECLAFYYYLKQLEREGKIIKEFHKAIEEAREWKEASKAKPDLRVQQ